MMAATTQATDTVVRRLDRLAAQIQHSTDRKGDDSTSAAIVPCLASVDTASVQVDARKLKVLLNGADTKYRDEVFDFVRRDPLFRYNYNLPKESLRIITRTRLLTLVRAGFVNVRGTEDDSERHDQYADAIAYIDNSLSTLIGAQFVLFAGSILHLGTEYHHQKYLPAASKMELRGCFAMTELGHGSNVRGLETTATYDPARDEFVIHTPSESAQKFWIGGGFESAQMATVFAQLYVADVHYGVHAFLVPLRDRETHKILPGVRIKDCGHKMGLNGIDNGRFWFTHVRIPRENLLNRFGSVTRQGEYESSIPDNDLRFAASLSNLVNGRIGIIGGSTNSAKIALTTAIRYGFSRRQFGPPGQPETPILDYQTHQFRLMPLLATTYAHTLIVRRVLGMFTAAQKAGDMEAVKDAHVIISGLKAIASWHSSETLQVCREACGGMGYKSSSRIGILKADSDISSTYEGDNYVLLQQLSRDLVRRSYPNLAQLRDDQELRQRSDTAYLRDADAQVRLYLLRETDLVARLAAKIKEGREKGLSTADVLAQHAIEAAEAGRAHIERFLLENLVKGGFDLAGRGKKQRGGELDQVERESRDVSVARPLALLRSLYALFRVDQAPSFQRGQYVAADKARRVQQEMLALCSELKRVARDLVDAFDIPDFLLGDIAGDWVAAYAYDAEDPV